MRLSWNEIRVRAARFARDWKYARYERGESQTFYNEFFAVLESRAGISPASRNRSGSWEKTAASSIFFGRAF
jgi:hypothetical protein